LPTAGTIGMSIVIGPTIASCVEGALRWAAVGSNRPTSSCVMGGGSARGPGGMRSTVISCWPCAVPSRTAPSIRCLRAINNVYRERKNDRMLPQHSTHCLYSLEQRSSQRSLPTSRNPWRLGCTQWSFHRIHLTLSDVGSLTAPYAPFLHRCSVQCPVSRFASHCWHTSLWRVQDIPSILVHFWTLLFTVYTAHYYGDSVTVQDSISASCLGDPAFSARQRYDAFRCSFRPLPPCICG